MTCNVPSDKRKAYVQKIVRDAIAQVDEGDSTVTQDTILGNGGLGHSTTTRMSYHEAIRKKLVAAKDGCVMKTLTPASFADNALVRVRDVAALVQGDLG